MVISDKKTSDCYLIDTGADISVVPPTQSEKNYKVPQSTLFAANGTKIAIYGEKRINLNLGLRRSYEWTFVIADVNQPIIGADFLRHYDLLVDMKRNRLIDRTTNIEAIGKISNISALEIKTYNSKDPFQQLLAYFVHITNPNTKFGLVKTSIVHHIETTGPPIFSRPRRLSPQKLELAKEEFRIMCQQGIGRPSKSNWAIPLHMVPKHNGDGDSAEIIED